MNKKERPIIKNLIKKHTTEIESFQNTIIRPIIKMQHLLLVASFKNYLEKRKVDLQSCSDLQINNKIKSIFNRDISYRNICLGLIIGHFSSSEFSFYTHHSQKLIKELLRLFIKEFKIVYLKFWIRIFLNYSITCFLLVNSVLNFIKDTLLRFEYLQKQSIVQYPF